MSERAALALVALAGCSAPTCEDVIDHLVTSRLLQPQLKRARLAACERDQPSARVRSCTMKATTTDEVAQCRSLDPAPGAAPPRDRADDEARLRALAHAAETYYIAHGVFPAPSGGPFPPVGAACRQTAHPAGEALEPDPSLWTAAPWTDLGFRVEQPSRAAFWYEVTDPAREAVVHAIFDLDCDGQTGQAVIAIRIDRGTPVQSAMITTYERD
ncbi:MAG: hypothetical protein K8W52_41645 [Deltaproteobacteria bacterium]|nr:hypothetical protein [Deltaproteobacteria bacterium]